MVYRKLFTWVFISLVLVWIGSVRIEIVHHRAVLKSSVAMKCYISAMRCFQRELDLYSHIHPYSRVCVVRCKPYFMVSGFELCLLSSEKNMLVSSQFPFVYLTKSLYMLNKLCAMASSAERRPSTGQVMQVNQGICLVLILDALVAHKF